jgi:hypothetical protein
VKRKAAPLDLEVKATGCISSSKFIGLVYYWCAIMTAAWAEGHGGGPLFMGREILTKFGVSFMRLLISSFIRVDVFSLI